MRLTMIIAYPAPFFPKLDTQTHIIVVILRTHIQNLNQLPLNSGAIRKMVKHPTLENCPKQVSIKNSGIPHRNSINKYGTKNAPTIL